MSDLAETTAPGLSARREIDRVCDELEDGARRGERPRIEDFLERVPEALRSALLRELVRIELEHRRKRGEAPQEGEYLSRFPEYWAALADLFIPGYELLSELGRGAMGVVYRARHLALGCEVALKVMRAGLFASAEELQRFRFEAQAVQELNHPAIVRLLGLGDAHGRPFLCLAYLEGGSLAERLRLQGPFPCEEAARLLLQVARAMQHAHERGILHRDLKPANILLDREGSPRVADFGLARRVEGGPALRDCPQPIVVPIISP